MSSPDAVRTWLQIAEEASRETDSEKPAQLAEDLTALEDPTCKQRAYVQLQAAVTAGYYGA